MLRDRQKAYVPVQARRRPSWPPTSLRNNPPAAAGDGQATATRFKGGHCPISAAPVNKKRRRVGAFHGKAELNSALLGCLSLFRLVGSFVVDNGHQLHIEDQCGIRLDHLTGTARPVGQI